MRFLLVFCVGVVLFICVVSYGAVQKELENKRACLESGGFPISKGHRSYDYHCFKQNPLLDRQEK
jgi:hypothetical protein